MKPQVFESSSPAESWVQAASYLVSSRSPEFLLSVGSGPSGLTTLQRRELDQMAMRHGAHRPSAVANMLCPVRVLNPTLDTEAAIRAGLNMLGRGRQRGLTYSGWTHTYFERLCGVYQDRDGNFVEFRPNRLLNIIRKIKEWDRNQAAAFYVHTAIDSDAIRPRGGPCLQYLQFIISDAGINIFAMYRSHDYYNKTLGNLLGIDDLGRFICHQSGKRYAGSTTLSLNPFSEGGKRRLQLYHADVGLYLGL